MSVEVVMPQMGESITEGTVSKWLKSVGDKIERDEPILEISTDKVDAEVPSPGAGVLLEIRAAEGETVEVGSIVGIIGEEGETASSNGQPAASAPAPVVEEAQSRRRTENGIRSSDAGGSIRTVSAGNIAIEQRTKSDEQRAGYRSSNAADGRIDYRGNRFKMAQSGRRSNRKRRAAFGDFDR
jgi:2-oxoglutarate dehydrogenase E2 component (dihydrolipoamide succinyltransferase)